MFRLFKFIVRLHLYRIYFVILIISCVVIYITLYANNKLENNDTKFCFQTRNFHNSASFHLLPDITDEIPNQRNSIFFHETSCAKNHLTNLNVRQSCAIESAALLNPDWNIYVLFASPVGLNNDSETIRTLISSYPNIYLRNVDIWNYAKDTPFESFIEEGDIFSSLYFNSHLSDYLRYLTLYKWRGIYLDLDIIVKSHFNDLKPNFAGAESDDDIAAGIISLDKDDTGSNIAEMFLEDFKRNFNGEKWGINGPGVITRVLHKLCNTKDIKRMTADRCHGFRVLSPSYCYAIFWKDWSLFFNTNKTVVKSVLHQLEDSIIVHFWNKHSIKGVVKKGENSTAYEILARNYCPKTFNTKGNYF